MAGNYEQLRDLFNNPTEHGIPSWDNDQNLLSGLNIKSYFLSIINSLTVGFQFMGMATTETEAGTPDQNVFYIAGAGTYNNFGATPIVIPAGSIGIIKWNGTWECEQVQVGGGSYVLPPATAQTLGGVKVGNGLAIQPDGTLSAEGGGGGNVFECGTGKTYTRLRDAVAAAELVSGSTVLLYPGTYDLTQEFATELATTLTSATDAGIPLKNDITIKFFAGAKVTAILNNPSSDKTTYFHPFYMAGSFTLINADIEAKNTRYCVHDEANLGIGSVFNTPYISRYINCRMSYSTDRTSPSFVACIGGGLGVHGTIFIEGGSYKSSVTYSSSYYARGDLQQQPISYHNANDSNAQSTIYIKNVTLEDKGYFRFGNYGSSTLHTNIYITGCKAFKPAYVMNENHSSSQVKNMYVFEENYAPFELGKIANSIPPEELQANPCPDDWFALPAGIYAFMSADIPNGLPSRNGLTYGGGCTLIVSRKSNQEVTNGDQLMIILRRYHIVCQYWGSWGAWAVYGPLNEVTS